MMRVARQQKVRALVGSALAIAVSASFVACKSKPPKVPIGSDGEDGPSHPVGAKRHEPSAVDGHLVASLSDRAIGPFLAQHGTAGMVMYIGTVEDGTRALVAAPIDADAQAKGEPFRIMAIKDDPSKLVVRSTGGASPGFAAAWSAITERGESIYLAGVGDDGRPRSAVTELSHTNDHVVWLDVQPTSAGAICIWAEETRVGGASLFAAAIDSDGKLHGSPSRVVRGVQSWQTVPTDDGVGLALVTKVDARAPNMPNAANANGANGANGANAANGAAAMALSGSGNENAGTLTFLRLDASAHAEAAPVVVTAKPEVSGDIDVVRNGDSYIFAWTDLAEADPYVAVAGIDARGKVTPPSRAVTAPTGGSSLVAIEAGPSGVALAWDEPLKRGRATRRVHLERLDAALAPVVSSGASAGPSSGVAPGGSGGASSTNNDDVAYDLAGNSAVELASQGDGFALLVTANVCRANVDPPTPVRCGDEPLPTFVRLDKNLKPLETEPLRMEADRVPAALAWDLACTPSRCTALTVDASTPAKVRAVDLPAKESPYVPPRVPSPPAGAPQVESLGTLASGASFTTLAAAQLGHSDIVKGTKENAGSLIATMAANADSSSAEDATVSVLTVDTKGVASLAVPITTRAVLSRGLAIAAGDKPDDGAAVVWVARDAGDLQVHVSRVDRRGRRVNDVMLTTAKGDASDVAVGWANGGWIVAWVDGRDGNGEVYATKVGVDLNRIAREERITTAPGDASDLTILAADGDSWLAWADPREDETNGTADVYYARIHSRDAKKDGNEARALASASHSRSPVLASSGDGGALLAWIEDAPLGSDPAAAGAHGAMLLGIDAKGLAHGDPVRLRAAGPGFATGIALESTDSGGLRAVLARSFKDDLTLDVLEIGSSAASTRATPLLTLDAPSSFDATLALAAGALYFDDDGAPSRARAPSNGGANAQRHHMAGAGDRRIRRATVHWTR